MHAGSSIIEVIYSKGGLNAWGWVTQPKGVTSMIDLGGHATVIATFTYGSPLALQTAGRRAPTQMPAHWEGLPLLIDDLPLAVYNRPLDQLSSWVGKADGPLQRLPALIWMPRCAHRRAGEAILSEEMLSTIDQSVSFIRMTIESSPGAQLINQIDLAPSWLVQLRDDHKKQHILPGAGIAYHPLKVNDEFDR